MTTFNHMTESANHYSSLRCNLNDSSLLKSGKNCTIMRKYAVFDPVPLNVSPHIIPVPWTYMYYDPYAQTQHSLSGEM